MASSAAYLSRTWALLKCGIRTHERWFQIFCSKQVQHPYNTLIVVSTIVALILFSVLVTCLEHDPLYFYGSLNTSLLNIVALTALQAIDFHDLQVGPPFLKPLKMKPAMAAGTSPGPGIPRLRTRGPAKAAVAMASLAFASTVLGDSSFLAVPRDISVSPSRRALAMGTLTTVASVTTRASAAESWTALVGSDGFATVAEALKAVPKDCKAAVVTVLEGSWLITSMVISTFDSRLHFKISQLTSLLTKSPKAPTESGFCFPVGRV